MRRPFGQNTDLVLALLAEGPKTARQLRNETGLSKSIISSIISRLRAAGPDGVARAHVAGWVRDDELRKAYPMQVYAAGPGRDAKKPPPKPRNQISREYWQRRKQRIAMMLPGADLQRAWQTLSGCAAGVESGA